MSYPAYFSRTPATGHLFCEKVPLHLNSDGFTIDTHMGGRVDTFIDLDYVFGARIVLEFREFEDQARNHYWDDLFIYRSPHYERFFWINDPHEIFEYGQMRDALRRSQFVQWFHAQGMGEPFDPSTDWKKPQ